MQNRDWPSHSAVHDKWNCSHYTKNKHKHTTTAQMHHNVLDFYFPHVTRCVFQPRSPLLWPMYWWYQFCKTKHASFESPTLETVETEITYRRLAAFSVCLWFIWISQVEIYACSIRLRAYLSISSWQVEYSFLIDDIQR